MLHFAAFFCVYSATLFKPWCNFLRLLCAASGFSVTVSVGLFVNRVCGLYPVLRVCAGWLQNRWFSYFHSNAFPVSLSLLSMRGSILGLIDTQSIININFKQNRFVDVVSILCSILRMVMIIYW